MAAFMYGPMAMTPDVLLNVVEAALLAAGRPLELDELQGLFADQSAAPDRKQLREALSNLEADLEGRALELKQVAGGYRLQVREEFSKLLGALFTERPPRYSRALQETLALIAYRQPVTRGEIEQVRGVAVSSSIIRTLLEREWIRVLGHREVPGRPALYGTTRTFLDHFNLLSLADLPPLAEIRDLDQIEPDLFDGMLTQGQEGSGDEVLDADAVDGATGTGDMSNSLAAEPQLEPSSLESSNTEPPGADVRNAPDQEAAIGPVPEASPMTGEADTGADVTDVQGCTP